MLRPLGRPTLVEWLLRICGDLNIGAMMIRVPAGIVEAMFGHELHNLQGALLAGDIRQLHVRFKRRHCSRRPSRMDEEAIGEHRNLRRILNRRRHGLAALIDIVNRPRLRVARQLGR